MMQETLKKYNKPSYTTDDLRWDPRLDGKMMQSMTWERWEWLHGEKQR